MIKNLAKFKLAFSLAEVLLVLTILGVVASETIPVLINDTKEVEYKIAWKSNYAAISQAIYQASYNNAGTFLGSIAPDDNTLLNIFIPYLNVSKRCLKGATLGTCWHNTNSWYYLNGNPADNTFVRHEIYNGSGVIFANGAFLKLVTNSYCYNDLCGWMLVDVNGFKKPNVVGKDIFGIYLTEKSTKPYGYQSPTPMGSGSIDIAAADDTCDNAHSGWGCSIKYLYN
jgi:prepilin-type N-terminal cleavage/methylation domain-containing protein